MAVILYQLQGRPLHDHFLSSFPDLQHTMEEMIAEDDRVPVRLSADGTHSGRWMQFAPSGKAVHYIDITLARIEGDKISDHHTWWDRTSLIEQLAQQPSDPPGQTMPPHKIPILPTYKTRLKGSEEAI